MTPAGFMLLLAGMSEALACGLLTKLVIFDKLKLIEHDLLFRTTKARHVLAISS